MAAMAACRRCRRRLLFCQKVGGQLPPLPPLQLRPCDIPISFIFLQYIWKLFTNFGKNFQVFHTTINLMWTAFPWKPWKKQFDDFFSLFLSPCRYHGVSLGDFDGGRYLHGKMDGIWRFLLLGLHQSLSRRLRGHLQLTRNKDQQQSGGMPEEGM